MFKSVVLIAESLAVGAPAQTFGPPYLPGVWGIGETRNCETGPAWVFLADGNYAEVELPDRGPSATGLWRDESKAIAYTYSHIPYSDMSAPNELKRLTVVARTADKLVTRNSRGVARIFYRCPDNVLKTNAAQGEH